MDGCGQKGSTKKEMGSSADHSVDLRSELEDRESESDWKKRTPRENTAGYIYQQLNTETPKCRPRTQNPEPRVVYTAPTDAGRRSAEESRCRGD